MHLDDARDGVETRGTQDILHELRSNGDCHVEIET